MYMKKAVCVDCGKEFIMRASKQVRCNECQEIHRKELDHLRWLRKKANGKTHKDLSSAVYINGHPQVCTHMRSCFYGSTKEDGCSYALEEHKSRICNGLYIVDGKCAAYERKGRKAKSSLPMTIVDMPVEDLVHNYAEV